MSDFERYEEKDWKLYEEIYHKRITREDRIAETISLIPANCSSILYAGCGDGQIVNKLMPYYNKVCGLDISR